MKKTLEKIYFFIFCIIVVAEIYGENIYVLTRSESLYDSLSRPVVHESLPPGDIVTILSKGDILRIIDNTIFNHPAGWFIQVETENGETGWVLANAIARKGSDLLPYEITSRDTWWTHSYYLDILASGKRETLFAHEPFWGYTTEFDEAWWVRKRALNMMQFSNFFSIFQKYWYYRYELIHGKIAQENNSVYTFFATVKERTPLSWYSDLPELSLHSQFYAGRIIKITLRLDGDFLDVFFDGTKTFTLVPLSWDISTALVELMTHNTTNWLTEMRWWPRRADGSTDYPFADFDLNPGHRNTANLSLRSEPDLHAEIITTIPQGTAVTKIYKGPTATIDGVTAHWVRIRIESQFPCIFGWVFSGYLEALPLQQPNSATEAARNIETNTNETETAQVYGTPAITLKHAAREPEQNNNLPIVPIAGGLLVVGIITAFAIRRNKQTK